MLSADLVLPRRRGFCPPWLIWTFPRQGRSSIFPAAGRPMVRKPPRETV